MADPPSPLRPLQSCNWSLSRCLLLLLLLLLPVTSRTCSCVWGAQSLLLLLLPPQQLQVEGAAAWACRCWPHQELRLHHKQAGPGLLLPLSLLLLLLPRLQVRPAIARA
jgi:hypothetical protein